MIDIKIIRELTKNGEIEQKRINERLHKANEVRFGFDVMAAAKRGEDSLRYSYGDMREEFRHELLCGGYWVQDTDKGVYVSWRIKND